MYTVISDDALRDLYREGAASVEGAIWQGYSLRLPHRVSENEPLGSR